MCCAAHLNAVVAAALDGVAPQRAALHKTPS
eukprot:COSAG06_NODE_43884_length_368_cov_0.743494_1_plen_30_part_01